MKLLTFELKGVLQSWGEASRWDSRDTAAVPTKSGIIGLLGACLGYPRKDERLIRLSRALRLAVRVDKPGTIMTDFQTVQATQGPLINAQGKKRPADTIISLRQYLQDASFTVFLRGDEEVLEKCRRAMMKPVWPPYLGRKCCIPTVPLVPEIIDYSSLEEAACAFEQERINAETTTAQIEGGTAAEDEFEISRQDEPLGTNAFSIRKIRVLRVRKGQTPCI